MLLLATFNVQIMCSASDRSPFGALWVRSEHPENQRTATSLSDFFILIAFSRLACIVQDVLQHRHQIVYPHSIGVELHGLCKSFCGMAIEFTFLISLELTCMYCSRLFATSPCGPRIPVHWSCSHFAWSERLLLLNTILL